MHDKARKNRTVSCLDSLILASVIRISKYE